MCVQKLAQTYVCASFAVFICVKLTEIHFFLSFGRQLYTDYTKGGFLLNLKLRYALFLISYKIGNGVATKSF